MLLFLFLVPCSTLLRPAYLRISALLNGKGQAFFLFSTSVDHCTTVSLTSTEDKRLFWPWMLFVEGDSIILKTSASPSHFRLYYGHHLFSLLLDVSASLAYDSSFIGTTHFTWERNGWCSRLQNWSKNSVDPTLLAVRCSHRFKLAKNGAACHFEASELQ